MLFPQAQGQSRNITTKHSTNHKDITESVLCLRFLKSGFDISYMLQYSTS